MRLEVLFPEKGQARVEIIDWPARGSLGRLLYFKRFAWYPSFFLALIPSLELLAIQDFSLLPYLSSSLYLRSVYRLVYLWN